jgi:osmotically-inducible protein OsmY
MRFLAFLALAAALLLAASPDASIERSLRARLSRSKLAADKLHFAVKDGVVEWQGRVSVPQRKGAATRMAKAAGAARVVNRITIAPSSPTGAPRKLSVVIPRRR